ncbi:MAG: hypothetical protein ACM3ZF_09455, partial [Mycobacterium leprae]
LVSFGDATAFEDTLQRALEVVFGAAVPATPPAEGTPSGPQASPSPSPAPGGDALARALADADRAFRDGQAALRRGDFGAYGEAQRRLQDALGRALAAQQAAGRAARRR